MTNIQQKEQTDTPDYISDAYTAMLPAWRIIDDISAGGTLRLRQKTTDYLPKFPSEPTGSYNSRLASSVFLNVYNKTVEAMTGLVFQKDVSLADDVPDIIQEHAENIDNAGTHISVFAKDLFKMAFEGHSFILVDMPRVDGEILTLADEQSKGIRPYWVTYKGSDAISWRFANINGQTVLEQIVFKEEQTEPVGQYLEQTVDNYRVWRLENIPESELENAATNLRATWTVYRETEIDGKTSIVVARDVNGEAMHGTTKLDRIPVTVVYGQQTTQSVPLVSAPPLLELALLNIKHFQKQSDYDNQLHIAGMPILCAKDLQVAEGRTLTIASGVMLVVGEKGNVWYAEPTGASLGAARQSLEDTKKEMALLGLSMLASESNVAQTATENIIDSVQDTSQLATMARSLQDAIETALDFHAQYLGLEEGGSVELGVNLRELVLQADEIRLLSDLQERGQITLESLLWNLAKAGKLPPDTKVEQELAALKKEKEDEPAALPAPLVVNPVDTGQPAATVAANGTAPAANQATTK